MDTWYNDAHPKTKAFIDDILTVCKKHKLAISPTFEGEISHHDAMVIVPLNDTHEKFIRQIGFNYKMLGLKNESPPA